MNPWILSGAGNTFLIEIQKDDEPPSAEEIQKLCSQYNTDGFLRLVPSKENQFLWLFYNRDGSGAEFCGNAARCAQFYISQNGYTGNVEQVSVASSFRTWSDGKVNWVSLPPPKVLDISKKLRIEEGEFTGFWCMTGVPHYVIEDRQFSVEQLKAVSAKLRGHKDLGPAGANVTWVKNKKDNSMAAVTFERGVEDFTQACGSGAYAVSLKFYFENPEYDRFNIYMPGGTLETITKDGAWIMTGPVEKLGEWPGSKR